MKAVATPLTIPHCHISHIFIQDMVIIIIIMGITIFAVVVVMSYPTFCTIWEKGRWSVSSSFSSTSLKITMESGRKRLLTADTRELVSSAPNVSGGGGGVS